MSGDGTGGRDEHERILQPATATVLPLREPPVVAWVSVCVLVVSELLVWEMLAQDHPLVHVACGALALATLWVAARLTAGHVTLGVDGVHVQRALRQRFIPHEAIVEVDRVERAGPCGLSLTLRSGEIVLLPLASVDDVRRADAALRAPRAGAPPGAELTAPELTRGRRSGGDWLRRLRALAAGFGEQYRRAPLAREQLEGLAGAATSARAVRVGAAVVLDAVQAGNTHRRALAASIAEPGLRAALESLSEAVDDEALAAALEQVAEDEADATARDARARPVAAR